MLLLKLGSHAINLANVTWIDLDSEVITKRGTGRGVRVWLGSATALDFEGEDAALVRDIFGGLVDGVYEGNPADTPERVMDSLGSFIRNTASS